MNRKHVFLILLFAALPVLFSSCLFLYAYADSSDVTDFYEEIQNPIFEASEANIDEWINFSMFEGDWIWQEIEKGKDGNSWYCVNYYEISYSSGRYSLKEAYTWNSEDGGKEITEEAQKLFPGFEFKVYDLRKRNADRTKFYLHKENNYDSEKGGRYTLDIYFRYKD